MKIAFAGFRHGHIWGLYGAAKQHPELEIVACAEEDAATRAELISAGKAEITHDSISRMLDEVECDIVAIGDCYARRGKIAIEALKRGKHVVSDKPVCTELAELDEIEKLAAENDLCVGCMFDLRTTPGICGAKQILDSGILGDIVDGAAMHPAGEIPAGTGRPHQRVLG